MYGNVVRIDGYIYTKRFLIEFFSASERRVWSHKHCRLIVNMIIETIYIIVEQGTLSSDTTYGDRLKPIQYNILFGDQQSRNYDPITPICTA